MRRSTSRILTTHVGKLQPRDDLTDLMEAHPLGRPSDANFRALLRKSVAEIVRRQTELGIDIVNDGEYGKLHFHVYLPSRLGGTELRHGDESDGPVEFRRDRSEFADFYAELNATPSHGWHRRAGGGRLISQTFVITGPVEYAGHQALKDDIDNLKDAVEQAGSQEAFLTAMPAALPKTADSRLGGNLGGINEYYTSDAACRYAIAEALRTEYRAIVDAGIVLQIDDPWLAFHWEATPFETDLREYRKQEEARVELLNHALEGIPEEMVRYHLCWGSGHGPHAHDLPLRDIVDIMLKINAQAYSIEAANARHEHEWQVWQDVKLPDGKLLLPGVVSHATNTVEHPELVAWRLKLFAGVVGKENVIASTDCGLGGRVHPQIAGAKLRSLVEGARIASGELWAR